MSKWISLNKTKAYNALHNLATAPVDLRNQQQMAQRLPEMKSSVAGLDFHYATQRLDQRVLTCFEDLSEEQQLIAQMKLLMQGETMNRIEGFECENRQVLHHATRDVFEDLHAEAPCEDTAVKESKAQLAVLKTFCEQLQSSELSNEQGESFTDLILVGIGGSDLGPRAIYLALQAYALEGRSVHFISNVDPDDAAAVLGNVPDLSRSLVCVISKSGGTLETLTNESLVEASFVAAGLDRRKHFICVTGEGGPMDNPEKYLRSFYMYDYIGGRYSVCSMVGSVMLAFGIGYDNTLAFLRGARKMDINALNSDLKQNLSLLAACIGVWNRNFLNIETVAILPYSQALSRFSAHLQQCDMESNGKRIDRRGEALPYATGPVIWGEPGTNGQHAFYQLIHQSETVISCDFIGFRESQRGLGMKIQGSTSQQKLLANLFAQSLGLALGSASENPNKHFPGNRPNSLIMADKLTPEIMGSLLAFYENKIAFQGFIWNVNSFDQEGVQLGKVLATEIIKDFCGEQEATGLSGQLMKLILSE